MKLCCVSGKLHYLHTLAENIMSTATRRRYQVTEFITADLFAHARVESLRQNDTKALNVITLQGQTPKLQSSLSTV